MKHVLAAATCTLLLGVTGPVLAQPLEDPIPKEIKPGLTPVRLETVATGLTAPNWGTFAPGDPYRLFVTDQDGILWAIDLATGDKTVFADVSALLVPLGAFGVGTFDERGLLGVAFHPDYMDNGLLYTYTSEPLSGAADFPASVPPPSDNPRDRFHESVITEWQVPDPGDPASVVDPTSRRVLLRIGEPQFNHNAGALGFGPDDMLYIALGDGGAADDQGPGHVAQGNGQDPSNVLGTILRIDPDGSNSANGQYGLPADNPFFPGGGGPFGGDAGCTDGFCDEIFAFGFRNPFRFSFDKATGDLYAADVGQNDIEEVDVVVAGGNYGWRIKEGSFCFNANGDDRGFVEPSAACDSSGLIDPVAEYDHDEGIAIVGGFVYRGHSIAGLRGRYVFGDFSRQFFGNNGRLFALKKKNIVKRNRVKTSSIAELRLRGQDGLGLSLLGFGQDMDGEIYVLANATGVPFGDTGVVQKIVKHHRRHKSHDHDD
jgi:glucose/arabinose dehydrogenase